MLNGLRLFIVSIFISFQFLDIYVADGRNRPSARLNQATRGNGTDGDASGIWA